MHMSGVSWTTVTRRQSTGRRFLKHTRSQTISQPVRTMTLEEVARLVESGQVVKWSKKPRCVNPLTVAVKRKDNGEIKRSLFLDLSRCLNLAINNDDYRMTTLQDAINATRKGDFQVVFDLKSAFHHIRLHASMYELMGFKVTDKNGVVTYYCYVFLVFGFKVAAQVLGRVLKPVICFLVQNGIPVVLYIDNGLLVGPTKDRVIRRYNFALDIFEKAGLMVSFEKSTIPDDASTSIEFLGVLIDKKRMCVFAAPHKIASLRAVVAGVLRSRGSVEVRKLASVVGKLN
jgi:hypothetical protein